jgi:hypothetical protein
VIDVVFTWILNGLTTGDWSPPPLNAILQLFQGGAPTPTLSPPHPDTGVITAIAPLTFASPPHPTLETTITLYQDKLASMRPVVPLTNAPPPLPMYTSR